jgi:SanA protein
MQHVLKWGVSLFVGTVALVATAVFFAAEQAAPYIYQSAAAAPTTTVALVLGASVYQDGTLSPVLAARADRAVELYMQGKVHKILVTGDNSAISHNEVNPVGKYMAAAGVPKEDIFLDHAGFDTYSSMYRARDVFTIAQMAIVSQPFHLARAVYIARSLGIDAYGVAAGEGGDFFYNELREVPATMKALVDLAIGREPKYLGPLHPIEGDGTETWE